MSAIRALFLFALACSSVLAGDLQYQWKPGELYRYDYERSSTVRQPDELGQMTERKTVFAGVLIVEIRSVNNGVATALMRFDPTRLDLPSQLFFGAQSDGITESAERSATVTKAMIAAIKLARWSVTLHPNGVVRIDSRVPEKFSEWTRELGNLGRWRTRLNDMLSEILEQDAGLKVSSEDREMLLSFAAPAEAQTPASAMRPFRTFSKGTTEGSKTSLNLQRAFSASAQNGYQTPGLIGRSAITMKPGTITMTEGSAVFDARLGLLDTLNESFTVPVTYSQGSETLKQEVVITYRLKRLAPTITAAE